MGTALFLIGVVAIIAFNIWVHDPELIRNQKAARRERAEVQRRQIVCRFCGVAGRVRVSDVRRKKGLSGGKATAGLLTGGASLLLVGLSRKEATRELECGNCGQRWDVV